jgi:hypothetical protein
MTLEQVEKAIYDYYQGMTKQINRLYPDDPVRAQSIRVREEGRLAQLWSLFDRMIWEKTA